LGLGADCAAGGGLCRAAVLRERLAGGRSGASRGVAQAAWDTGVPVAFGILTTDTLEQAVERAGTKGGNKGFDAAATAIEMAQLMRSLKAGGR